MTMVWATRSGVVDCLSARRSSGYVNNGDDLEPSVPTNDTRRVALVVAVIALGSCAGGGG